MSAIEYDYHATLRLLAEHLKRVQAQAIDNEERRFDDPVIAIRQASACFTFIAQAMGIRDNGNSSDKLNEVLNAVPRRFIVTEVKNISGPEYCKHVNICKHYEQKGEIT